jgi:DNA/RNA-binding domain of Phe-tRNA-synthetase-like protein
MLRFNYHSEITSQFPDLHAGVIQVQDITNSPTPDRLKVAFQDEQTAVLAKLGDTPLSELETLKAWRAAFRSFGVNPTKYRSAPEALLRRLTKKGDIPTLNTLVDICNLVSIRYALPVAAFDLHALQGPITVRYADGTERFTPLGITEVEHPEPGEVIFADETALVVARRWCWRQSAESAAGPETRETIFTIEAQHPDGGVHVKAALDDLLALLGEYAPGDFYPALLPDK